MGILDDYKKMFEEDIKNEDYELPENSDIALTKEEMEEYRNELEKQRSSMYSMFRTKQEAMEEEKKEKDDPVQPFIVEENMRVTMKKAYCPICQNELKSDFSEVQVALLVENDKKTVKHKCICGYCCDLEHSYPIIVYVTEDNNDDKVLN